MLDQVQGRYPPGSTYKLLVALCALEGASSRPTRGFHCAGHKVFYNRDFRCDNTHGTVDLVQAIARSCGVCSTRLGVRWTSRRGSTPPPARVGRHRNGARAPGFGRGRADGRFGGGGPSAWPSARGANSLHPRPGRLHHAMLATGGWLLRTCCGTQPEERRPHGAVRAAARPQHRPGPQDPRRARRGSLYQVWWPPAPPRLPVSRPDLRGQDRHQPGHRLRQQSAYRPPGQKLRDNALFAGYAPRREPPDRLRGGGGDGGFGAERGAGEIKLGSVLVHRPPGRSRCRRPAPSCPTEFAPEPAAETAEEEP